MPETRTRAEAFDEWMRRYIEDPHGFEVEFRTVETFLTEEADGVEPSYGTSCAAYLAMIEAGESVEGGAAEPPPAGGAE